jgi:exportin-T
MCRVVQLDYPQQWPTFFHDMMAMLGQGAAMADVWCRVLVALDEEIISLDIPRTNVSHRMWRAAWPCSSSRAR